ncbi:MAG: hypothetical protein ACI837_001946 [Crocinitomicaceae bacterium]|jgi:hypothetical protein
MNLVVDDNVHSVNFLYIRMIFYWRSVILEEVDKTTQNDQEDNIEYNTNEVPFRHRWQGVLFEIYGTIFLHTINVSQI